MSSSLAVGIVALAVLAFRPDAVDATFGHPGDQPERAPGVTRPWPCRIIVQPPLSQVVEGGWYASETFRRQCEALAERGAVAELRPGAETSAFAAQTRITLTEDGVVVGRVMVPLTTDTIEHIAHELEHVLERAEGMDFGRESRRKGSGVWQVPGSFETQRAIDIGRQVAREVRQSAQRSSR